MYYEQLGWIESPFNPNKPDPRFILYDDLGREILSQASRESGRIFYVYGKIGMGKTTLGLWMSEVAEIYDLDSVLIHGGRLYDPEIIKEKLKLIIRGPSFFKWIISKLRRRSILRYIVIVDDVTEIPDRHLFESLVGLLELPSRHISICMLGNKKLNEWPFRDVFTNRSIIEYELKKPPKEKILQMIRSRIESVGGTEFHPLTLDEILMAIEEKETIRDILLELEKKVIEKTEGKSKS
ncbi:MAG: hypothetical protein DRN30_00600 [Thermoplasmata archaeon]|nr:MAG: hypothetical protein DRN30_00600 [Thermoplasmata archaeon]